MSDTDTNQTPDPAANSGCPPVTCSRVDGILIPANYSFEAINEFVHHPDVEFEELQWAMLGMATERDAFITALRSVRNQWGWKMNDETRAMIDVLLPENDKIVAAAPPTQL